MKIVFDGKTKSVLVKEETGQVFLLFKDSVTGDDGVFDPGSNTVGGSVEGKGRLGLLISQYFFKLLESKGIPTQYLGHDLKNNLMEVRNLQVPKLEFILRYYTAGSICRRYSLAEGLPFDPPYAEVTLKDDEQGDPLISERLCLMKGLLDEGQYGEILTLLERVGQVLQEELHSMGFTLIDFKIEVGLDSEGKIYVADEITPDIWRVQDKDGRIADQVETAKLIANKITA